MALSGPASPPPASVVPARPLSSNSPAKLESPRLLGARLGADQRDLEGRAARQHGGREVKERLRPRGLLRDAEESGVAAARAAAITQYQAEGSHRSARGKSTITQASATSPLRIATNAAVIRASSPQI